MRVITVDLETFWDTTHSLSKMSAIEYAMHPDTDIISCSFKIGDGPSEVVFGEKEVKAKCRTIDWSYALVIGHNMSMFDAMILAWRCGVKPQMWGCTLAMATPKHAKTCGVSLAKLVQHYQLGVKDNSALVQTKGKRLKDFTKAEIAAMAKYNADDTDQCYALFMELKKGFKREEMLLIHMTIVMLVEPKFEADIKLLEETLQAEKLRKEQVLEEAADLFGVDILLTRAERIEEALKLLSSTAKFKQVLESRGVTVPMKTSPTTGKEIPALAKSDEGFMALLEHPSEVVSSLAGARLDAKSTLLQTRIGKFIGAAKSVGGKLPIPLRYYGADTTGRWSGWAYNPQNLPRVHPDFPKNSDALRRCLTAPKGKAVVVADLSGIELRVNHFLWKVPRSMEMYQNDPGGADLYRDFAAHELYEKEIIEVTKSERQVGKVAHLGLGFGAGAATFQIVAKLMGGVELTLDEAQEVVWKWRDAYAEISRGWKTCHAALPTILRGEYGPAIDPWGMVRPTPQGLETPVGFIYYPHLQLEKDDEGRDEYFYGVGRKRARIYAGKIDENIVQHLARNVIAENAIEVYKASRLMPVHMVHDELVYIVDEKDGDSVLELVQSIMRKPPSWWPELVTWSEGDIALTYGDAK